MSLGTNPKVVVRSYEAIVALEINRGGSMSAQAWQDTTDRLASIGGELGQRNQVILKGNRPSVVAYETVDVEFVSDTLTSGGPSRVVLTQARAALIQNELELGAFGLSPSKANIKYALLGNDRYSTTAFGGLDVVEPSQDTVATVLNSTGAESLTDVATPPSLNSERLQQELDQIVSDLQGSGTDLFVFYYVGHAVAAKGGQLYLVMQDYEGDPFEDLGEDLLLGLSRETAIEPMAPMGGSNVDDLLDVLVVAQAEWPEQVQGLVPVSDIVRELENAQVPFLVLIDACYEHDEIDALRSALNLTESGDYIGPDLQGGPAEILRFREAIQRFSTPPYLRSTNPVIFSATPGTLARVVRDPRPSWPSTSATRVGPLASRLYESMVAWMSRGEEVSWAGFARSIVDVQPVGEVRIYGTVSWSDYGLLDDISMFRRQD